MRVNLFALLLHGLDIGDAGWIHGLKIVAVAIVAQAILGMATNLTPDLIRKAIALFALVGTLLWQTAFAQVGVIIIDALLGFFLYKQHGEMDRLKWIFLFPADMSNIIFRTAYSFTYSRGSHFFKLDCHV